ncbi:hypothetical protein DPMN_072580 [Dreissena polymorpha]|uniref:G-protein coupled receptors family 1 profile domain-containing protein n=1 Tax=Dreissena polymorpha TaxID=45954 RepID=A0A9D3Z483_DREPO|nr:hypothetical protein DPMN_072580 [Dreissena polymorpha]
MEAVIASYSDKMSTGARTLESATLITTPDDAERNVSLEKISIIYITSGPILDAYERLALNVYIYPISLLIAFMFIGVIGNGFVLYIFSKQWERSKTSVFIITLAALDVVNCSLIIPVEISVFAMPFTYDHDIFCKISRCLSFIVTANYSFVLVTVAYDRYLMVCKPLKRITYGQRYATRACIGVSLLAIATQWPSIFIYGTHTFKLPFPRGNDVRFLTNLTNSTAFCVDLTDVHYVIEGKTCHVTNYYDDINKIPKFLFHGFLMVGHVVINITLFVVYTVIGHRLFLSSYVNVLENRVQKPGLLKKSIVSALTGTASKGKSASNSIDTDNFATYPKPLDERARSQSDGQLKATVPKQCTRSLVDLPGSMGPDSGRLVTGKESGHEKYKESFTYLQEENVFKTKENINGYCRAQLSVSITSAFGGSTDLSMLHLAAPHPQAKPVANLKELSLKRNTLIMRMVTFTFMMSYLPYLILVMLRYLDEDIPRKLPTNLKIVYQVFLKSYFLNSVLRPFIYIVMNERYRMKLLKLIRSWRRC